MSKHETPMTRWYWRTMNGRQGLLIEEFPAVKSVGVCREDDLLLHKVLRRFKKCEAIVYRRGKK